jgi:hypothetical protein
MENNTCSDERQSNGYLAQIQIRCDNCERRNQCLLLHTMSKGWKNKDYHSITMCLDIECEQDRVVSKTLKYIEQRGW